MKKTATALVLTLAIGGGAVVAMGGMDWIDSLGLRGQERLVETRVNAYWNARMKQDLEVMAKYMHPHQGTMPDPGLLVTESFEVNDVQVDGDVATAKLSVQSRLRHPIFSSRERDHEMISTWVRYEGQWYLEPQPTTINDRIRQYQGQWTPPGGADMAQAEESNFSPAE